MKILDKTFTLGQLGTTEEYEYQLVKIFLTTGGCPTRCFACHEEIRNQCVNFSTLNLLKKELKRFDLVQKLIKELPEGRFEQIMFEVFL